jgi:Holliday junction resolvase RusA-like endonuclease
MLAGGTLPVVESPVSFVVPGDPVSWMRPRANARGAFVKIFNAPAHEDYLTKVRAAAHEAMAGRAPFADAVAVTIVARFSVPPSWTKTKRKEALLGLHDHTIRLDTDNIAKIINDGMNKIVFADDCQITNLVASKRYAELASVLVRVTPKGEAGVQRGG